MHQKELSELTYQELLAESKALKSFSIKNAIMIVLLVIIMFYSYENNYLGFLILIPLALLYKILNSSKSKRLSILEKILKERNLK